MITDPISRRGSEMWVGDLFPKINVGAKLIYRTSPASSQSVTRRQLSYGNMRMVTLSIKLLTSAWITSMVISGDLGECLRLLPTFSRPFSWSGSAILYVCFSSFFFLCRSQEIFTVRQSFPVFRADLDCF